MKANKSSELLAIKLFCCHSDSSDHFKVVQGEKECETKIVIRILKRNIKRKLLQPNEFRTKLVSFDLDYYKVSELSLFQLSERGTEFLIFNGNFQSNF